MHARTRSTLLLFCSLINFATITFADVPAHVPTNGLVQSITFSGTSHLAGDFLYTVLHSRTNVPFHPRTIHKDIVALMSLPQIADVVVTATPSARGIDLHYSIREAPTIMSLVATRDTPSRRIPRRFLRNLQPGLPFSPLALFTATQELQEYFHTHHYHAVVVSGSVVHLPSTNLVNVVLRVHEGPKQFLSTIIIEGNHAFSDRAIRNMLHCKERNRWLFRPGAFLPAQLARDCERIRQAYLSRGYLDAHVDYSTRVGNRANDVSLLIHISEGPQYVLGSITWHPRSISSNQLAFLQRNLSLPRSTPYSPNLPDLLCARIAQLSRAGGFPEPACTVRPLLAPESSPRHPVVTLRVTLAKQTGNSQPLHPSPHQPLMTVISP